MALKIKRRVSNIEVTYERMRSVIMGYGGKPPTADEPGSLRLVAEFAWALNCDAQLSLAPNHPAEWPKGESEDEPDGSSAPIEPTADL